MRLLNVNTRQLEEFFGNSIPSYAILSHTWGKEEVSLQDLSREGHQQKQGYTKIEGCCQQAIKDDLSWVWVDTCCIDKTSSAELSEAINSMFHWYRKSKVCYAYLQDVPSEIYVYEPDSAFRKSRWFTRGWTLQELLAPKRIEFYDTNWTPISFAKTDTSGDTIWRGYVDLLSDITSIHHIHFNHYSPPGANSSVPAACVFSWMARRSTSRVEDEAYCLLGLLNVNMPLLYGEGNKAFIRLQEVILSGSDDMSSLTWGYNCPYTRHTSYVATSPTAFLGYSEPRMGLVTRRIPKTHTTVTGRGLHIELLMILINERRKVWVGIVEEHLSAGEGIAIVLQQIWNGNQFARVSSCPPVLVKTKRPSQRTKWAIKSKQIYITHMSSYDMRDQIVAASTTLERLLFRIKFWSRTSRYSDPVHNVVDGFCSQTGYSLSSSWPPIREENFFDEPSFVCSGPDSTMFYMIFSNEKQDRFAVRIEIEWRTGAAKVVKTMFRILTGRYIRTALEHCCGTKIDSRFPQFTKDMQWRPCVTAENVTTKEIGYVYATNYTGRQGVVVPSCSLVWTKGLYSEEGSMSAT